LEFHKVGDPNVNPDTITLAGRWAEAILGHWDLWGSICWKASQSSPWLNVGVSWNGWPGCQLPRILSLFQLCI
jgi:hypothetical protein